MDQVDLVHPSVSLDSENSATREFGEREEHFVAEVGRSSQDDGQSNAKKGRKAKQSQKS